MQFPQVVGDLQTMHICSILPAGISLLYFEIAAALLVAAARGLHL